MGKKHMISRIGGRARRQIISIVVVLAMLVTCIPGISNVTMRAQADSTTATVTVWFEKPESWADTVYTKFGEGTSWNAISGHTVWGEFGNEVTCVSGSWYGYTIEVDPTEVTTIYGLFDDGAWGTSDQTSNWNFDVNSEGDTTVWITVDASTMTPTVSTTQPEDWDTTLVAPALETDPVASYESPIVNDDGSVTFYYQGDATTVIVSGSFNGWPSTSTTSGAVVMTEGSDNMWSATVSDLDPGKYEYKFVVNDSDWITDPANSEVSNGNSVFTIPDNTATTLTVHFNNTSSWSNVCAYVAAVDSSGGWSAISGYSYCFAGAGAEIEEDAENSGWYAFQISVPADVETVAVIFTNGNWNGTGDGAQTGNEIITLSTYTKEDGSMELWIDTTAGTEISDSIPTGCSSNTSVNAPIRVESTVTSPVINDDGSVTFNYDGEASTVIVSGTFNGWPDSTTSDGVILMEDAGGGSWSYTLEGLTPGEYQYKFIVDGSWMTDPANDATKSGNSVFYIAGLADGDDMQVKTGDSVELPTTLSFYDESGNVTEVEPTYSCDESGVTIDGTTLSAAETMEADTVLAVTATYTDTGGTTYTSTIYVTVVANMYTYTIHYYADNEDRVTAASAALWLWTDGVNGIQYGFTGEETVDGYTWLTYTWETSYTALYIIVKDPVSGEWDWQSVTYTYENADESDSIDLYLVDGIQTVYTTRPSASELATLTMPHYVLIEYVRSGSFDATDIASGDLTGWNIYTWDNGYDDTYEFKNYNGDWIAVVRVTASNTSMSFCMRYSDDITATDEATLWADKDGGDHVVTITPGQYVTKVIFTEGEGVTYYYPDNAGYELFPEDMTFNMYYRDDDLYLENKAGSETSVTVNVDGTDYTMTYDADEQRWEVNDLTLTEGKHLYYYTVDGVMTLDSFNSNKTTNDDGETVNYFEYYKFEATVTARMNNGSLNYSENDVMYVDVEAEDLEISDGTVEFEASAITADLSQLGGRSDFPIQTELMAGTIAVVEGTATGTYSIPVYVTDQFSNKYSTTVDVTVTSRNKGSDFDWDEAVIYFAVTDRFYDGNTSNNTGIEGEDDVDLSNTLGYHGGDFAGLTEKLDYLEDLGVNTIWITPIVANADTSTTETASGITTGYHGYWASSFEKLNGHLGTEAEFSALLDAAHARGMKVMVDVVLNHAGYDTEDNFTYVDSDGVEHSMIRSASETVSGDYQKDSSMMSNLPDFVTENPEVRALLVEWQSAWISKYDIDYYRVDTVKHVEDTTWAAFKNALTEINPSFKMVGEYSGAGYATDTGTLRTGEMDSLLDFDFNDQAESFVRGNIDSVESFMESRNASINNTASMAAFLSSHDEDGLIGTLINDGYTEDEATELFYAAASLELTAKGQVVVYYGEEIGQYGYNDWPIQSNRNDFDWDKMEEEAASTDMTMLTHYKRLLSARSEYSEVFAKGSRTKIIGGDDDGYIVFAKTYGSQTAYVGINLNGEAQTVSFDVSGTDYEDIYDEANGVSVSDGVLTVTIPALSEGGTVILVNATEETVEPQSDGEDEDQTAEEPDETPEPEDEGGSDNTGDNGDDKTVVESGDNGDGQTAEETADETASDETSSTESVKTGDPQQTTQMLCVIAAAFAVAGVASATRRRKWARR